MITNVKSREMGQIKEYENETRQPRLSTQIQLPEYSTVYSSSLLVVLLVNCKKKIPFIIFNQIFIS